MYGWKKLQLWCLKCFFVWHNFHDEDKFVYFNIISNFCSTNRLYYIDNRNIRADFLYKAVYNFLSKGKTVLGNNFIIKLNQKFWITHIHHPPDVLWIKNVFQSLIAILWKQTCKYYRNDRVKFHNNSLLSYLNIKSLWNKVTDLRIIF